MKIAVTGGAGFIGSHLTDSLLLEGHEVLVIDDLSSGSLANLNLSKGKITVLNLDVSDDLSDPLRGADCIFHFAADPDVRSSINPQKSFERNVIATFNLLESSRKADVKRVVFASTSAVYGEAKIIPTPETYPTMPISNYGASKLASEGYLSSYASCYGMKTTALRYANIFGERSTHGVMFDFYQKLKTDPTRLKILGNGKQDKSYLHVSDCVWATVCAWKKQQQNYDVFNVGSRQKTTVIELAEMLCNELGVKPKFDYTGTDGGAGSSGWVGDVRLMLLDSSKIEKLGWKEKVKLRSGVKSYVSWLKSL